MHRGYVKLWRKFYETSFYKSSPCVHLAIHLLMACNHEPKKAVFNKKELMINRGECLTGLLKLKNETGISIRSLRTALQTLVNIGFLTSKTTNKFRILSIDKYSEYQDNPTSNPTIKRQSNDNQTTTNKNEKNDNNDKNTTIASDKPAVVDMGKSPVNWENCKTDHQRFMAYYVKSEFPTLYVSATQAQASDKFKRYGKAAREILTAAGDLETAKSLFDKAKAFFIKQGLSWNLSTVAKNCDEFANEVLKGNNEPEKRK